MPWGNIPPALRPEGPGEPERRAEPTPAKTLATFQAAVVERFFTQGIGLWASALGWTLPARWAGGLIVPRLFRDRPLVQGAPMSGPAPWSRNRTGEREEQ